jgi:hypothetical protein
MPVGMIADIVTVFKNIPNEVSVHGGLLSRNKKGGRRGVLFQQS